MLFAWFYPWVYSSEQNFQGKIERHLPMQTISLNMYICKCVNTHGWSLTWDLSTWYIWVSFSPVIPLCFYSSNTCVLNIKWVFTVCHLLVWYLEVQSKVSLYSSNQEQTINKKAGKWRKPFYRETISTNITKQCNTKWLICMHMGYPDVFLKSIMAIFSVNMTGSGIT